MGSLRPGNLTPTNGYPKTESDTHKGRHYMLPLHVVTPLVGVRPPRRYYVGNDAIVLSRD